MKSKWIIVVYFVLVFAIDMIFTIFREPFSLEGVIQSLIHTVMFTVVYILVRWFDKKYLRSESDKS
ncbi:hypothetical protein [Marinilactibacillus piezotolerans]|uniref:hypothetical protein n=1 Tax=Marinilactibacillus piezotolerans TaxID=258723 RepID=UPI0009AFB3A0|nr:hypothetical protein [Marinilactibacillus piezotolerans]